MAVVSACLGVGTYYIDSHQRGETPSDSFPFQGISEVAPLLIAVHCFRSSYTAILTTIFNVDIPETAWKCSSSKGNDLWHTSEYDDRHWVQARLRANNSVWGGSDRFPPERYWLTAGNDDDDEVYCRLVIGTTSLLLLGVIAGFSTTGTADDTNRFLNDKSL